MPLGGPCHQDILHTDGALSSTHAQAQDASGESCVQDDKTNSCFYHEDVGQDSEGFADENQDVQEVSLRRLCQTVWY